MKKLISVATVISLVLLTVVALLSMLSGEFFKAVNLQLGMVLFATSTVLCGLYLVLNHAIHSAKSAKISISILGLLIIIFSIAVSFNLVDFLTSFNWLISCAIMYVLLVQLQLLHWGNNMSLVSKIAAYSLIASNVALAIYFIAQWRYAAIGMWISIAVALSIISFIVGLIGVKKNIAIAE